MTEIEKAAQRQTREWRAKSLANQYRQYDSNAGFDPNATVTKEWILEHVLSGESKCEYCGCSSWKILGLDRKDNSAGHTEDNVVVACSSCNTARGDAFTYEDFRNVAKFVKPIKNSMNTSKLYTPRGIEDFLTLKHGPNRQIHPSHVEEILQAMNKGTLENRFIVVEENTMTILSGQHRVKALLEYYDRTGKLYDLEVLFVDLGGDTERMRNFIIGNEADRKGWLISDYIYAYRDTPQHARFERWMEENGQTDLKVAEWVLGLNAKAIKSNHLIISERRYEAASKAIKFCREIYERFPETVSTEHLDNLYNSKFLHIAIASIFDAEIRGNRDGKKVMNMHLRVINDIASKMPNGFFDFAKYFTPVLRDAELHKEKVGKKPNSSDWIRFIFMNAASVETKVMKAAKKNSVRRLKIVAE